MMRNKNRLFACLTFVALLATMQPLFAEPKPKTWYQIEVLIYEPIRQTTANEHWPSVLDENTPRSSIDLSPVGRSTTHKAFQKLPPEALTLNAKAKRLAGSRKYRLITLQGWQQPVKQRQEAVAVHLADKTRVDGEVTVSLSRYLHMALNIRYYNPDVYLAEQIAQQKINEVIIDTFELKQSRRMRSKEVHVFDHPYFGVIATIIPVKRITP